MSVISVARTDYTDSLPSTQAIATLEEMARLGNRAVFSARKIAMSPYVLSQVERRDRAVLLLLDGKRTLQDVARLIHRSEIEVAYVLIRLLNRGFIEFLGAQKKSNGNR